MCSLYTYARIHNDREHVDTRCLEAVDFAMTKNGAFQLLLWPFLRACSCFFVCASASAAFFFFFRVCVCKVCTVKQDVPYIYLIVLRLLRCCNREKTAVMKDTNHISYARLLSLLFFFSNTLFLSFFLAFRFSSPMRNS